VTTGTESERERDKRQHQRTLFDGIAERYEMTRPGYPERVIEFITATAGLGSRAAVLEVGCGTGQLTEQLACSGSRLIAIDIGPSMIAAARQRLTGAEVSFLVTSFEDLAAVGPRCGARRARRWHWTGSRRSWRWERDRRV
jgi:ubiquinone/menaquinone biosynthesis C-methylase UbiE